MRQITLLAFAAALIAAPAVAQTAPPPAVAAFERELDTRCTAGEFTGVAMLVIDGAPVASRTCGQVQPHARFRLLSSTKLVSALAIMKLVEEGRLSLDAPIARYIPDLPPGWRAVTVRHLLHQTSGVHNHANELSDLFRSDRNDALRRLLKQREIRKDTPNQPPGRYRLNDFGYELLVDAAERATGQSWARILQTRVFDPAGMTGARLDTAVRQRRAMVAAPDPVLAPGWNEDQNGARVPAAPRAFALPGSHGVIVTAADLIALDRALAQGRVVRPETWAAMIADPVPLNASNPGAYMGLGVMVGERDGLASHGMNGGLDGYVSVFRRFPDQDAVVIGLFNSGWAGSRWLEDAAATALATP